MTKYALSLLTFLALVVPSHAGVSISFHSGGFGYCGGGYSRGGYGYCGGYRGGYYRSYPIYAYGYYGSSLGYISPSYYDSGGYYPTAYTPAPAPPANPGPSPQAAAPAPAATAPLVSIPAGTVDAQGNVHSPFSTTTFKAEKVADGQLFHDPITGQLFQVHTPTPPAPPATPPTTSAPTGKLDEFGYVHSPYSTYTFQVKNGDYAQTFHDPYTGQPFNVRASEDSRTLASANSVD